jgi:hypothetical protein
LHTRNDCIIDCLCLLVGDIDVVASALGGSTVAQHIVHEARICLEIDQPCQVSGMANVGSMTNLVQHQVLHVMAQVIDFQ